MAMTSGIATSASHHAAPAPSTIAGRPLSPPVPTSQPRKLASLPLGKYQGRIAKPTQPTASHARDALVIAAGRLWCGWNDRATGAPRGHVPDGGVHWAEPLISVSQRARRRLRSSGEPYLAKS